MLYGVWGLYLTDVIWEGADDSRFETGLLVRSDFWHGWWDVVSFLLRFPQEQSVLAVVAIASASRAWSSRHAASRGRRSSDWPSATCSSCSRSRTTRRRTPTTPSPSSPILALAIGVLAGWVLDLLEGRRVLQGAFLAVVAAAVVVAAQRAYTALTPPPPTDRIAAYREIGELTGHTTRSIIVDPELGTPAMYWGWIATRAWEIDYLEQPPAWIEPDEADYLIVVDTDALESHAGLARIRRRAPGGRADRRLRDLRPTLVTSARRTRTPR